MPIFVHLHKCHVRLQILHLVQESCALTLSDYFHPADDFTQASVTENVKI